VGASSLSPPRRRNREEGGGERERILKWWWPGGVGLGAEIAPAQQPAAGCAAATVLDLSIRSD